MCEPRRNACLPSVQPSAQQPSTSCQQTEVVLITETSSELYLLTTSLFASTFHGEVDPSVEQMSEYVKSGKYQLLALVDKSDRSLVGGAILGDIRSVHQDFLILEYFFVNPLKRGKGIGSSWFLILLDYIRQHTAYKYLVLECVQGLLGFYARFGAFDTGIQPSLCVKSLSSSTTTAAISSSVRPASLLSLMAVSLRQDGSEMSHDKAFINTVVAHIRRHLHSMITCVPKTFESDAQVESYNVWAQAY
jgi:GNAT superfamily N-acetyltransferase